MTRHEDPLPIGQEMADEISDRVRLAGAGRALDHDGVRHLQLFDDALLLGVGALGEEQIDGLSGRDDAGPAGPGLVPDEPQERFRDLLQIGKLLDVGLEGLDVALAAIAEEEQGSPIQARDLVGLDLGERVTIESVRPELVDERLEELTGRVRVQRVERLLFDLLAQLLNRLPVDARESEEWRVELGALGRFFDDEFRHRRIEDQLDALEQDRVLDHEARLVNAQDAVGQEQLQALGFSLELPVQLEQVEKDVERLVELLFGGLPRPPLLVPLLEGLDAFLRLLEGLGDFLAGNARRLATGVELGLDAELFPVRLEPLFDGDRRPRALGLARPRDLEDEARVQVSALHRRVARDGIVAELPLVEGQVDHRR